MSPIAIDDIKPLAQWGLPLPGMFLCAGPCSAESREQLLQTAAGLSGTAITVFRAGIWKPRTRPGTFSGIGLKAIPWLVHVREQFGFPVGCEVAMPQHVEAALAHELDLVWIGARTSVDPFAVQAIADALRGADIPVLVKNPVSPDLELWLGGLERVYNAGIRRLGAIHRGFTTFNDTRYRNAPLWRIPIELKRRLPDLPLICDPSHMAGRAELVPPTAQEALDLLFDGLMVEVHHDPASARSDAAQQLSPGAFGEMVSKLVVRRETGDSPSYETQMHRLRGSIDEVDGELVELLARRMQIARDMGDLKRSFKLSTLQPSRWQEILASRTADGEKKGLNQDFVSQIYQIIHEEAIRVQEEPLFGNGKPRPKETRRSLWDAG
jgi:chorismate mutase